jgi:hypothetical protein
MSNGINETNSKHIDDYVDFRFQDAAQAIFLKYQSMDMIKPSNGITTTTATSLHKVRDQQETIINSRACTIL